MKYKKILFIGLGGAGQRHLRILYDLLPNSTQFFAFRSKSTTPLLNADFTVNSKSTLKKEYNLTELDSIESAFSNKPDLTVISTPSSLHVEYMMKAIKSGSAIFVEKPWSNDLNHFSEFRDLIINKKKAFNISFQRRYDSKISKANKLIKNGKIGKPISASFNVFSNVPFWHPYEDWKKLYAVNAKMGGGVLLTEIHEIDLVCWFFGVPKEVFCAGGNRSEEKLDIEDTVQITLMYKDFSVQITLCFMHKKQSRNFHIAGSSGDITWDGSSNKLTFSSFDDKNNSFTDNEPTTNDDMFYNQARKFINDWSTKDTELSLNSASSSLAIVAAAKKSIISRQIEKVSLKNVINL